MRGGVPVFSLPTARSISRKRLARVFDEGSPARPARKLLDPTCTRPARNVPAVNTTVSEKNLIPS